MMSCYRSRVGAIIVLEAAVERELDTTAERSNLASFLHRLKRVELFLATRWWGLKSTQGTMREKIVYVTIACFIAYRELNFIGMGQLNVE